jgi:hypothetical protein
MSPRGTFVTLSTATVALVFVLIFAGISSGTVLLVYVLFAAAVLLAFLVNRLRATLPAADDFKALLRRAGHAEARPDPFEIYRIGLSIASGTQWSIHVRLRPLAQRIASARLSYRHGIDLEREPQRAEAMLQGTRTWELIRPDRQPPEDDAARGWREPELKKLLEELEDL